MTRDDFETIDGTPVIRLRDGRTGLCTHWNNRCVQVDAYGPITRPGEAAVVELPWRAVERVADTDALLEVAQI
jgi:hypothetical protein